MIQILKTCHCSAMCWEQLWRQRCFLWWPGQCIYFYRSSELQSSSGSYSQRSTDEFGQRQHWPALLKQRILSLMYYFLMKENFYFLLSIISIHFIIKGPLFFTTIVIQSFLNALWNDQSAKWLLSLAKFQPVSENQHSPFMFKIDYFRMFKTRCMKFPLSLFY